MSLFYMSFLHCSLVYSSALSFPRFSAITKLNGTNYKRWVESLMMNLIIMKLNLALKVEIPLKPNVESSANEKKFYEDWDYSNSCCLIIMENHMEDSIYASIPKIENAKDFLYDIGKKYTKLSKQKLRFNKGRRSKWFILTKVVTIMVNMMRRDATLDHLRSTFRNVALMLSIQCLVLLNRM